MSYVVLITVVKVQICTCYDMLNVSDSFLLKMQICSDYA
ncbi:hypothetical protein F383_19347 [Gossypium arboreum]|uniref:Uncharacterized protein n=1 Tax=Gossypium arboreum TaxID=29729 RepID=A0A0B0NG94_GOSAR|nr:hypothetical protein F383_19347 [Gossypium arboreum]